MSGHYLMGDSNATTVPLSEAQWRALVVVLAGDEMLRDVRPGQGTDDTYPWALRVTSRTALRLEDLGLVEYDSYKFGASYSWRVVPTQKLRSALASNPKLTAEASATAERLRAVLAAKKAGRR